MTDTIEKVSIIISKGSLDGIYPGLIMANGARAEGIEANLFFTFFGLDAGGVRERRLGHGPVLGFHNRRLGFPLLHFAALVCLGPLHQQRRL